MTPATRIPRPRAVHGCLVLGDARETLARIVSGDPLGLRRRLARRMRERALLLDLEQGQARAFALVALWGARYRGRPALQTWLRARIDEVLDDLLARERLGSPSVSQQDLAARFEIPASALARGRERFHALPLEVRETFVALVVESRPIEAVAEERGLSVVALARNARRGMLAFVYEDGRP